MTRKNLVRSLVAASLLAAGTGAFAQADNSNSASDPTYYGSWYYWNPLQPSGTVEVWTYRDYATPRWYVYGPTVTYRGPAVYDGWRYYDPPGVTYYTYPAETPLGIVTDPAYMGPRDATR